MKMFKRIWNHLTPIRMATIKKKITSVDKDMKKMEPLCTVGEKVKWCSYYGKQYGDSSKS